MHWTEQQFHRWQLRNTIWVYTILLLLIAGLIGAGINDLLTGRW